MKNKWPVKKLGEVIILNYGKAIPKSDRKLDGKYPIYGANGELGRTDKFLVDADALIIGRKGSVGEITKVSGKFWPSDVSYYVLGNNKIDINFLFYLLGNADLKRLSRGVKPGINRNKVYDLEAIVPPIEQQREIVEKLEKVLSKISEVSKMHIKQLEDLELFKQSILTQALQGKNRTKLIL